MCCLSKMSNCDMLDRVNKYNFDTQKVYIYILTFLVVAFFFK